MRLLSFSNCRLARPAVFLLAVLAAMSSRAGGEPEKIEFSEPSSPVIVSNLNRLGIGQQSLKEQIQEDLFSPFKGMNNSFDPVMPSEFQRFNPPQQPVISKKQQEEIQEQVEWVFTGMTQLSSKDNLSEILGIKQYEADGSEKKTLTPEEKYYESLGKEQSLSPDLLRDSLNAAKAKEFSATNGFNPLSFIFQSDKQGLEKYIGTQGPDSAATTTSSENSNPNNPTPEEKKRAADHADLMRQLLKGGPITSESGVGVFGGSGSENNKSAADSLSDYGATTAATSYGGAADPLSDYFSSPGASVSPTEAMTATEPHSTLSPFAGVGETPTYQSSIQNDPTRSALGLPQTYQLPAKIEEPATPAPNAQSAFSALPGASLPKRPF